MSHGTPSTSKCVPAPQIRCSSITTAGWAAGGCTLIFQKTRGGREASKKWFLVCASKRTKKRQEKLKETKEKRETNEPFFFPKNDFFCPRFLENRLDFPLMIIKKYSRSQPEFKRTDSEALESFEILEGKKAAF